MGGTEGIRGLEAGGGVKGEGEGGHRAKVLPRGDLNAILQLSSGELRGSSLGWQAGRQIRLWDIEGLVGDHLDTVLAGILEREKNRNELKKMESLPIESC